jgi:hypothetical protein
LIHDFSRESVRGDTNLDLWTYMDDIKMDRREIGCEGVEWIQLALDGVQASSCEHGNEPSVSIKVGECID